MSRVLLFVRTMVSTPRFPDGDDRPKCMGEANPTERYGHPRTLLYGHRLTPRQAAAQSDADQWWLVQCENAAAGRRVIAWHEVPWHRGEETAQGRILASGRRST